MNNKKSTNMFLFDEDKKTIKAALTKIEGGWINASNLRAAGKVIWIMAAGLPFNSFAASPLRVPTRSECVREMNGMENKTLADFCRFYKKLYPAKKDYELDFYEGD